MAVISWYKEERCYILHKFLIKTSLGYFPDYNCCYFSMLITPTSVTAMNTTNSTATRVITTTASEVLQGLADDYKGFVDNKITYPTTVRKNKWRVGGSKSAFTLAKRQEQEFNFIVETICSAIEERLATWRVFRENIRADKVDRDDPRFGIFRKEYYQYGLPYFMETLDYLADKVKWFELSDAGKYLRDIFRAWRKIFRLEEDQDGTVAVINYSTNHWFVSRWD
jgi:hypothetical protein